MRTLIVAASVLVITVPVRAGFYSSIDTREETRYSRDYDKFGTVIDVLSTISVAKPVTDPPIRKRYLMIEALGSERLESLEQKIDYSTVLIRRGRATEAVRFLAPVYDDHRNNFLVLAQFATAHFLTANPDFEPKAVGLMDRALKKWPSTWDEVPEPQQKFLKNMGWDTIDFDRFRRCEEHLQRMIVHRLNQKKLLEKRPKVEDTLDPIFLNGAKPIAFLNDKGEYEAGKIAAADKDKLRRDSVEDVEQLLIWMPNDDRLLWLLAETLNASAMDEQNPESKKRVIHSAYQIFERLTDFKAPAQHGLKEISRRKAILQEFVAANPINVIAPIEEDPYDVKITKATWWRHVLIASAIGFALGLFALWQIQEMRRRAQARSAK